MSASPVPKIGRVLSRTDNVISRCDNNNIGSVLPVDIDAILPKSQAPRICRALSRSENLMSRVSNGRSVSPFNDDDPGAATIEQLVADMELMKERFSKLLLGEDMSGGGKSVSSALALSNAITNLSVSVLGEQRRLEPIPVVKRSRWRKEIDWMLSVADHIVELQPCQQKAPDGTEHEVRIHAESPMEARVPEDTNSVKRLEQR